MNPCGRAVTARLQRRDNQPPTRRLGAAASGIRRASIRCTRRSALTQFRRAHVLDQRSPDIRRILHDWLVRVRRFDEAARIESSDPYSDGVNGLDDIPQHMLKEIEHFFQVYKDLEGVATRTRGFEGATEACDAITEAMALYKKKFGRTRR